jgi:hypothetical protein
MDKIREEFEKWYNHRFANGNPDPEACQHGQEDMFESFQAAYLKETQGQQIEVKVEEGLISEITEEKQLKVILTTT